MPHHLRHTYSTHINVNVRSHCVCILSTTVTRSCCTFAGFKFAPAIGEVVAELAHQLSRPDVIGLNVSDLTAEVLKECAPSRFDTNTKD